MIVATLIYGSLFIDDELNPEITKLKTKFSQPVDLNNNAYIELIRLGTNMSYQDSLELYRSRLKKSTEDLNSGEYELRYPSIENLSSNEDTETICKLEYRQCLEDIKNRKKEYEQLVQNFKSILANYRKLAKLDNFNPINSYFTEPDIQALANLNKLATLEIYIDILNGQNEVALSKLASMIELDRKFLASSHELIFDISSIVNMSARYAPLALALKRTDTQGLSKLLPVLTPLSNNELTMNRSFLAFFAHGTELLKLSNIVAINDCPNTSLDELYAKQSYKENMTLNADYELLKINLIPTSLPKAELLEYLEARKIQNEAPHENLKEEQFFSIDRIRNPVGEIMLRIKTPKYAHIFEDMVGLDLNIMLIRILIQSDSQDLHKVIESEANRNPYKDERAFINSDGLLCFSTSKEVCLSIE